MTVIPLPCIDTFEDAKYIRFRVRISVRLVHSGRQLKEDSRVLKRIMAKRQTMILSNTKPTKITYGTLEG